MTAPRPLRNVPAMSKSSPQAAWRWVFCFLLLVGVLAGYRARFVSEKEDDAEREAVREAGRAAEEINGYLTVNSL